MKIIADTNIAANGWGCRKSLSPFSGCIFSCLHFHWNRKRWDQCKPATWNTKEKSQMCFVMERYVYDFDTFILVCACVCGHMYVSSSHYHIFFGRPAVFTLSVTHTPTVTWVVWQKQTCLPPAAVPHLCLCHVWEDKKTPHFSSLKKKGNKQMPLMPALLWAMLLIERQSKCLFVPGAKGSSITLCWL